MSDNRHEGHVPLKHFDSGQEWRSPDAVAGDRVHTLQVLAVDAPTGEILWTRPAYEGPVYDDRHRKGSYAAPTPVTDGVRVYGYFGSEGLYAYGLDGTLAWKTMLGRIASMSVGLATSPVLFDGLMIIQADEDSGTSSFIAAVDAATGKERWRVPRPGMSISWGTPVVSTSGGRAQLTTAANEAVVSYDPHAGQQLWREAGLDSNAVPSPVLADDLVIISAGSPAKKAVALRLNPGGLPVHPVVLTVRRSTGSPEVCAGVGRRTAPPGSPARSGRGWGQQSTDPCHNRQQRGRPS